MSLNIDLNKVNEKKIDHYLQQFGLKANGKIASKVNALERHQRPTTEGGTVDPANMSAPCDNCGGVSDYTLPECPFCGVGNDEDIPAAAKPNGVVHEEMTRDELPGGELVAGGSAVEAADAVEEDGDDDTRAGSQDDVGSHHDPEPPTRHDEHPPEVTGEHAVETSQPAVDEEAPADAEERTMKTTTQKLTKVKRQKGDVVETTGTEIAAPAVKLDAAVKRVHEALSAGAMSYWDLGRALVDIYDDNLWKQRTDGTGRQAFPSFNVFLRDELHMSGPTAFSVMDAARHFSKKDFELIGHSKLTPMLRLPEDRRTQLFEEAKAGKLSRKRILEIIDTEVPKGSVRETGRRGPGAAASAAGSKALSEKAAARKVLPKPDGELTAVRQLGRVKLKLWQRPNVKKPNEKPVRAVSVTQDPWCEEKLANGVVVRYTVVKTPNGLELVVETKRAD